MRSVGEKSNFTAVQQICSKCRQMRLKITKPSVGFHGGIDFTKAQGIGQRNDNNNNKNNIRVEKALSEIEM